MTCLRTRITHITPITRIRGWVMVTPESPADPLWAEDLWVVRLEAEGIQTYPTPFYPQRPTGPHRLWSSLLSILGMRMNTCRYVFSNLDGIVHSGWQSLQSMLLRLLSLKSTQSSKKDVSHKTTNFNQKTPKNGECVLFFDIFDDFQPLWSFRGFREKHREYDWHVYLTHWWIDICIALVKDTSESVPYKCVLCMLSLFGCCRWSLAAAASKASSFLRLLRRKHSSRKKSLFFLFLLRSCGWEWRKWPCAFLFQYRPTYIFCFHILHVLLLLLLPENCLVHFRFNASSSRTAAARCSKPPSPYLSNAGSYLFSVLSQFLIISFTYQK